jgi:hypothetical protein
MNESSLEGMSLKTQLSHARVSFLWGIATGVPKTKADELFEIYMNWYDPLGERTIRDKLKHHNMGLKYLEYISRKE